MITKRTVMIGAIGGMMMGAVLPMVWGDYNTFGLASIAWSTLGGLLGIWAAVWLSKRFG